MISYPPPQPLDSIKVKTMRTPLKQMPHSNSPAAVTPPGTLIKGASVTPGGRLRVAFHVFLVQARQLALDLLHAVTVLGENCSVPSV